MTEENKLGSTKKGYALGGDTVYAKEVWNEAIEAAAKLAEGQEYGHEGATEIRKLKK